MTQLASPHTDRPQWIIDRRSSIGASETSIVLGLSGSRMKLCLLKQGKIEPDEPTDAMLTGLEMEPFIARRYERLTGLRIVETQRPLRHPRMPWLSATLDAIAEDGRAVEFKMCSVFSPYGRQLGHDDDLDSLPAAWMVQVNQQMALGHATGATNGETADVAVWMDNQLKLYRGLRRNDLLVNDVIVPEVRAFWHDHVLAGVPPEEVLPQDAETLAKLYRGTTGEWLELGDDVLEAARSYEEFGRIERAADKARDAEKAKLLAALGNAAGATLPGGWKVVRNVSEIHYKPREAHVGTSVRLSVKEPKS